VARGEVQLEEASDALKRSSNGGKGTLGWNETTLPTWEEMLQVGNCFGQTMFAENSKNENE